MAKQTSSRLGQTLVLSPASNVVASTAAFGRGVSQVRICASQPSWYLVGSVGVVVSSTASGVFLPANVIEYLTIAAGEQISVTASVTGTFTVTEIS